MFDLSIFRQAFRVLVLSLLFLPLSALGAEGGTLRGTVTDPLGAVIVSATGLLDGTSVAQETKTDIAGTIASRCRIRSLPGSGCCAHLSIHYQRGSLRHRLGKAQVDVTLQRKR